MVTELKNDFSDWQQTVSETSVGHHLTAVGPKRFYWIKINILYFEPLLI